jgi:hypothetical protein
MKAIFYDRKNKRQVSSDELMSINFVEVYMVSDSDELSSGKWMGDDIHPLYYKERQIANLGYKSEECKSYCNWDLSCRDEDLVFLRMEE